MSLMNVKLDVYRLIRISTGLLTEFSNFKWVLTLSITLGFKLISKTNADE